MKNGKSVHLINPALRGLRKVWGILISVVPAVQMTREENTLQYWRLHISRALSLCFIYLGALTMALSVPLLIYAQSWGMVALDLTGMLVGGIASVSRRISYRTRTMIQLSIVHLIGLGLQISVTVPRGGLLWFFTFTVLAGILLGVRAALVATLINSLTMIGIGVLLSSGLLAGTAMVTYSPLDWFVTIINFLALNSATAILASLMVRGLQESIQREKMMRQSLEEKHQHLAAANRQLEVEMENRLRAEARLKQMATTDGLTGLPNRALFIDRLDHAVALAKRSNNQLAVLFVDLDDFKSVNDAFNHQRGDEVLREFARCLAESVRSADTVARMSGDEFCVLLENVGDERNVIHIIEKIMRRVSQPFTVGGATVYVTGSTGAAVYPSNGTTSQELLQNADAAMYRAKARGKNTYQFYNDELALRSLERLELLAQLRKGLQKGEFRLFFQPVYDGRTGRVIAAEALIRWLHPGRGLLLPGSFIEAAEDSGIIQELGAWVLQEAAQKLKEWREAGLPVVPISLNISGKQLDRQNITNLTRRLVLEAGLDPHGLQLEVTENSLLRNFEEMRALLEELKGMGFRLAIDDFGTGYSSLSYLARYPFDTIKIDRAFVRDVDSDAGVRAIVQGIVSLAQNLDMELVAEGIETQEQCTCFIQLGCYLVQGWYFNPALPEEEWIGLLKQEQAA